MAMRKKSTILISIVALLVILALFVSPSPAPIPPPEANTMVNIEVSDTLVCEGQNEQVTLTICETNTGAVDLNDVSVELSWEDGLNGLMLTSPPDSGDDGDGVLQPGEIWCWDIVVTVNMTTTFTATGYGKDPAGNDITYPDYATEYDEVTVETEPCGGDEGCTPGFWKNNGDKHSASAWCDRFYPSMHISDILILNEPLEIRGNGKNTITDPTLLQALDANGGGVNAMIRHGVAALLNACSGCVNYPINDPDAIACMMEEALDGQLGTYTVDELHDMFASWNEAGCPLNQHGECVGEKD